MRGGTRGDARTVPGQDAQYARMILDGPVRAVLLRRRGYVVLHASVVEVSGGAALFLGGSGWGKSTMAAVLVRRGYRLVTDDVAAIDATGTDPAVLPGGPDLKLWPDTLSALGRRAEGLRRVHRDAAKRTLSARRSAVTRPVPLRRAYVLADGRDPAVRPLPPREAFLELVRHTYGPRTLRDVHPAEHFRGCARIAAEIPVARLVRPRALERLDEVARLIERDAC